MKKIYFLFLFALIASLGGVQAAEKVTTFDFVALNSENNGSSNITVDDVTFLGEKGSASTAARCWSDGLRTYKGNNISFSVPEGYLITKIVFSSGLNEWTGSQQVVEFNNIAKATIKTITVTYETPNVLMAPEIEGVASGETYYGSTSVSISYPDLATSMTYTITKDGAQYKQETVNAAVEGLALNEAGAYKVEATATDGINTTVAEAVEFTIVDGAEYVYTVTDAKTEATSITTEGAEGTWTLSKALTFGQKGNAKGVQLGSSDSPMGEFTLTLDKEYNGIIAVIVNAATASDGVCSLSVSVGDNAFGEEVSLTNESADYEFTGNASGNVALNFNASSKACYLKSIIIITSGNDTPVTKCATPVFSLAEGTYNETQTLTITSTEGSTIVYTINDEMQTAPSPAEIELPVDGVAVTYTIKAYAKMEGAEDSEVVTKTYTIDQNAIIEQTESIVIAEVADEMGWMDAKKYEWFQKDGFKFEVEGDENCGKYYESNKSWRIYADGTLTVTSPASTELESIEFTVDDWKFGSCNVGSMSENNRLWTAGESGLSSVIFTMSGRSDIVEMLIKYKSIPAGVEGVEAADAAIRTNADGVVVTADGAVAEVYNAAGQLVAAEAVDGERVIALPAGFYIVRVGDATAKVVVK